MRCFRFTALAAVAACFGFVAAPSAQAVSLSVGNTTLPGTTLAARPELASVDVTPGGDLVTPFSFDGVTGTVVSSVAREDGSGTLDFYWQINVDASSSGGINAFRLGNFGFSNLTDADWRIDGTGTVNPDTALLFDSSMHPEGDINFLFSNSVLAGQTSRYFFLHTDATSFAKTAQFDLLSPATSNLSGQMSTFAPVPEPSSLALLVAGLALLAVPACRKVAAARS